MFKQLLNKLFSKRDTLIIETRNHDETVTIKRVLIEAHNMTRIEYKLTVMQLDEICLERAFETLADAFKAHYMYLMHTFADSVYAIDDDNAHAYASFR
jgi:hypothetical protein